MSTSENSNGTDNLWEDGVRAFLSYKAEYRSHATEIKKYLGSYGITTFLAGDDIPPLSEWQNEIMMALKSMDFMIALLTPGFEQSVWVNQEIGYALGRNVPVIPASLGSKPYGFIGKYQTIDIITEFYANSKIYYEGAVRHIFEAMLRIDDENINELATDAFVKAVSASPDFSTTGKLLSFLPLIKNLTEEQTALLIDSYRSNDQVHKYLGSKELRYRLGIDPV